MSQLAALVFVAILAATTSAHAFEGEKELYEAAKKDKQFTWYTAHYNSETAAAVCNGFEAKYPDIPVFWCSIISIPISSVTLWTPLSRVTQSSTSSRNPA